MKLRKSLTALFLAGTMIMGMGTSAMAADENQDSQFVIRGTEENPAEASVRKHLEFAEGITVPTATFKFNIEKITSDAANAEINNIDYTSTDDKGTLTDGKYVIHKDQVISFGTFPHAGEYSYKITEIPDTYEAKPGENVDYSKDEYTLNVFVANGEKDGALYIQSITATKTNVKQSSIHFTNIYTKTASLTVEKNITGELADKTKDFDFKITFYPAANSTEKEFTGKIGDETLTFSSQGTTSFKLHHGEQLVFDSLPAGTRYKVEEVGAIDGYEASVSVIENGVQTVTNKKESSDGAGVTTEAEGKSNCLVGENENKVSFTNAYQDIAVTGVIMNNLPFLLLIVLGVCALGLLAVSKKRRANR